MITDPDQRRDDIAAAVLAALVGLGAVGALLDATGHPALAGLLLAGFALLVAAARWIARVVRERREDAADALAGAAWRARHLPQLAARIERDRAEVA